MEQTYPFPISPLPYSYVALMPQIDADTLYFHYDHYAQAVRQLNQLVKENHLTGLSMEELLMDPLPVPKVTAARIKSLAGTVQNHRFYFDGIYRPVSRIPDNHLTRALTARYGSLERFTVLLTQAAESLRGSGWVWLILENGEPHICTTCDNETVDLRTVSPLFVIDLWEHAYFTLYQFDRKSYLNSWLELANWDRADQLYRASDR